VPVVFYECQTWSVKMREEYRLRVFESRVLANIFGRQRDRSKFCNEGLYKLCFSQNTILVNK
jgi:hypothetical protein